MDTSMARAHAVVRGRVQMVGFRAYAQRHASRLGLRGTVRNLPDGTLEAVIEGPSNEVDRMLQLLREGPSHARVDAVDVRFEEATGELPPMRVSS